MRKNKKHCSVHALHWGTRYMSNMKGKNGSFSDIHTPKYVLIFESASAYKN